MAKLTHLLINAFIFPFAIFFAVISAAHGNVVVIPLIETVKEPVDPYFPLPDSGQTASYTATFGEDHDYTINPPSYNDNGDGTVTDNITGLVWQQSTDGGSRTWESAWSYCQDLSLGGMTDWYLPGVNELMSIAHYGTDDPAIDSSAFPDTAASSYWTATTTASNINMAWYVWFGWGSVSYYDKSESYYVRCVR